MSKKYLELQGTQDGVNTVFTLPIGEIYLSGTVTLIVNGISYPPDDSNFGFSEVNNTTLNLHFSPPNSWALLIFADDGVIENVAVDINISGSANNFSIDWNVSSFSIETKTDFQLDFNTSQYSLTYNTNGLQVGV
jgi:hypothetical protein